MLVLPISIFAAENFSSPSLVLNTQTSPNISRQKQLAMGHLGVALYPDFSFGFTYGQVEVESFGWYANITTDFGFNFSSDFEADEEGFIDGTYPFYTGKKKTSYFGLTVGGIARIEIPSHRLAFPLFLMGGVGYGNRTVTYEMADGSWANWKTKSSPRSGLRWEMSAMANVYDDIVASVGIASVTNFNKSNFFELKLGVGYFF